MKTILERYTELISELKDTIYRVAVNLLGDSAEAEDVTQDIYERVWRARDAVLDQSSPKAYVCRMTHNLAVDRLRHKGWQSENIRPTIMASDGNRTTELNDLTTLAHQAIATLPEKQRLIIHLRDVEGYEFDEIAQIVGSDEASVRVNLSRARKAVREQLLKAMNHGVERD